MCVWYKSLNLHLYDTQMDYISYSGCSHVNVLLGADIQSSVVKLS